LTPSTKHRPNSTCQRGDKVQLLVENLGRVDYWSLQSGTFNALLQPHKGIVGDVTVGGQVLENWDIFSLPLDPPPQWDTGQGQYTNQTKVELPNTPVFFSGRFMVSNGTDSRADMELDTFLAIPNGTKGVVWVNGFNLGRYWIIGPQQSLYLPGVLLNKVDWNEVSVLELEPTDKSMIARGLSVREWANYPDPDAP
jgi:hypothetical protein